MSDRSPTQILSPLDWLDPRAHALGDTWLVILFTVLCAIGLPWLLSGVQLDLADCALGLLALAILHAALAVVAPRLAARPRARARTLSALHALGVVALGFIWQRAGGLQNPLLLAVFVLPVIGAVFISRWQPYLTAALSIVIVCVLAAGQAPLDATAPWTLQELHVAAAWLVSAVRLSGSSGGPFAAFYAPAGYYRMLLLAFAVAQLGCAVAVEYLRTVFDRLQTQVAMARGETLRSQNLWSTLVEELPLPALLIDAETREIIGASALAQSRWRAREQALIGRELFDAVHFSYPEAIEALIVGRGGVEPLSIVRADGRLLATEVHVRHFAESGRRLALVTVSDITEAFCTRAALDAVEHAALVVDAAGRVLALNRPARAVFPDAQPSLYLSQLLPAAITGSAWWIPGMSRCTRISLTVQRRVYRVTSRAVPLPGEEERVYVIAFMPAAALPEAERTGIGEGGVTTMSAAVRQR